MIIERPQRAGGGIAEEFLEPVFSLAGIEHDAKVHRLLQLWRNGWQHRESARDVEPTDGDIDASCAEPAGQVHRARVLVGLHADQPHHAGASLGYVAGDPLRPIRVLVSS